MLSFLRLTWRIRQLTRYLEGFRLGTRRGRGHYLARSGRFSE
jgi:hypothetical protein